MKELFHNKNGLYFKDCIRARLLPLYKAVITFTEREFLPIFDSMKSLVVLLANGISDYAFQPVTEDGRSAFASALECAAHFSDYAGTVVTAVESQCDAIQKRCDELYGLRSSDALSDTAKPSIRVVPVAEHTAAAFFKALTPFTEEADHFFIVWADAPFLDAAGAERLYAQHCKYKAEYSFADGYPEGLIPQIVASGLIPILASFPHAAEIPLNRSFLFDTVKKDINSYDLETMIAPDDVRYLRLAFYTDTKASWLQCRHFTGVTAENYAAYIAERQELLRPLPAYYGIEITAYHPLHSIYRPDLFPEAFSDSCCMDVTRILNLIDSIAAFSDSAVISLSLYGEPLLHPHLAAIVTKILTYSNLSALIETSGVAGMHTDKTEYFEEFAHIVRAAPPRTNNRLPVYWIVGIDALGSKTYGAVHRLSDEEAERYLKQAATTADILSKLFPKAVWAQMIRMNENEAELEPFFRLWEKRDAQPLIQKYDHICGLLSDRRPADISPLKRHPCWHLKRDMAIRNDGSVPLCKEDCNGSVLLGNVFTVPLDTIWEKGQCYYQEHIKCYEGVCKRCDEYYTYNF